MGITRKQLKDFGATEYLVQRITRTLQPVGKRGRAYEYKTQQVLRAIRYLIYAPQNRETTKATLAHLEVKIESLVEKTIPNECLLEVIQRANAANARFEQIAGDSRQIAQQFKTYKKNRGSDFTPKNNIVAFKI
ncbi:MAG: hypothetical protein WA919_01455 [Coleofasciculaceae cyanobacterium]